MIRRREILICTNGGFPYLLCHGLTFLCAGLLSFALPAVSAVWAYVAQPVVAMLLLKMLAPTLGVTPIAQSNELRHLLNALMTLPLLLLPLYLVVALQHPHLVPVISASVFAVHLIGFAWLWQHQLYAGVGSALAIVIAALFFLTDRGAFHFAGLTAGVVLLILAGLAYRHAAALSNRAAD
ncbi:MAG: hypothetical protein AB8G16_02755 [Gammaproteobacteria bacterium]